jgi:predicted N-formylglutamate amidohydrolase
MDWLLGTLDREELVREAVRVERHLWWDCGIEWVRRLLSEGDTTIVDDGKGGRLPRHPLWDVRILKEIAETSVAEYEGFDGDREGRDGNA